jgi:hypothetical protein
MATPIKIKFKHHPSPPTGGCTIPFGLCIIIPIPVTDQVSSAESVDGFGIADSDIVSEKVHLVFHRRAALDDGTIPIAADWDLGNDVASALGYRRIVIKKGNYSVDFTNYREFGEAFFDADFS